MPGNLVRLVVSITALCWAAYGQSGPRRFALILDDAPVSAQFASKEQAHSEAARSYRQRIESRHQALRSELAARNISVVGSASTLLNAVFVTALVERLEELKSLPGVKGVVAERRYRTNLSRAAQLINAPAAWTALNGIQNAGAGMKIAIIDNGIDQTHPAFQDASLQTPAGFPICKVAYPGSGEVDLPNCSQYTNSKVIVARSYVPMLAAGSNPNNPAADSRPDDYSPRDRSGHGTAVASAAASVPNTGPLGIPFNGVAPKAYLGNYKVFGSPEVNEYSSDDVIVMALEDALNDQMDVASLSLGEAALSGPLDTGAACGNAPGVPCELIPPAVENAVKAGMVVVIAAGNDGDGSSSYSAPALNTIESPGDSPSAITVGSTTNSHYLVEGVEVPGANVPVSLQRMVGYFGDGPFPSGALNTTLRNVTQLGDDGLACSALPAASLTGVFALIERGTCSFLTKVINAQNAGAAGVLFYMADQSPAVSPFELTTTTIPSILISNADGTALQSFIRSNANQTVVIDPEAFEMSNPSYNLLSFYSSLGPTTGDNAIKPDLVATGGSDIYFTDLYLATQSYDALGQMYSANGYTAASGTSFATPLVAGAAVLVKQAHPNFTPAQIKSALVNTASQDVTSDEQGGPVSVLSLGAGKLDAGAAVAATVTANPTNISFGAVTSLPISKQLQITNHGAGSINLSLAVTSPTAAGTNVAVDQQSLSLAAGASANVNVTLSGSFPAAGAYPGMVTIQGNGVTLRVPYLFLAGSGTINNIIVVSSPSDGAAGQDAGQLAVKLIDPNGVPVSGAAVNFTASNGASLQKIVPTTNQYGIASAEAFLGSQAGGYNFTVSAGGKSLNLTATAMLQPSIPGNGVVDSAIFASGKPVAPGSYISIFGSNLSRTTAAENTTYLPLAIDYVTVSFDVPAAKISVPGRLVYVSPAQVNVQVPWELQGQSSVQMKVTVSDPSGSAYGNVVTVPLADYAPAFFQIGGGAIAAEDTSFHVIGPANPAHAGQTVQLFANGLGPVNSQPASGDPAPLFPLANCKSTATVSIGGQNAPVGFCGLAPAFAGLYQLNVAVPLGLPSGNYPVTVSIGGQTSTAANILIQ